MLKIPFTKYTSNGNNFVIVDETKKKLLKEKEKSNFAIHATSKHFGIGSDGVIFIQNFDFKVFQEINFYRQYWKKIPVFKNNNKETCFLFRIFEPNGKESFSCGNGLLCIANYISVKYGLKYPVMLTQIPGKNPKFVSIGFNKKHNNNFVIIDQPGKIPEELLDISFIKNSDNKNFDTIDLNIDFSKKTSLLNSGYLTCFKLSGHLVFSGEPHCIVFVENNFPMRSSKLFFPSSKILNFENSLIHNIGIYLNEEHTKCFPQGINIDFVKKNNFNKKPEVLEYRCFERGINKETMACGTGALAVAFLAKKLNIINTDIITIWPYNCRSYNKNAQYHIEEKNDKWILYGKPVFICEGEFVYQQNI